MAVSTSNRIFFFHQPTFQSFNLEALGKRHGSWKAAALVSSAETERALSVYTQCPSFSEVTEKAYRESDGTAPVSDILEVTILLLRPHSQCHPCHWSR